MIDCIYIDNYKCFSSFQYEPGRVELILGDNGSGKSSLFGALRKLREFLVTGASTLELFPASDLTAWDKRSEQKFEIGLTGNGGRYFYSLTLQHDRKIGKNKSTHEILQFDEITLYEYDGQLAHLFRDNGSEGPVFPFDWNKSAIATLPERNDNGRISWFRNRIASTFLLAPNPLGMRAHSETEEENPDPQMQNLSAWLRHLFQEDLDVMQQIKSSLKDVLHGLQTFKHEKTSEKSRSLRFQFDFSEDGKSSFWLPLDGLSDGQRQLVALYAVQHAMLKKDQSVCLDEPDNYVSLREIQPWLTAARDAVEDNDSQLWIISHNPELIDYLAADHGVQFYRDSGGPIRVKEFEWKSDDHLKPSQIIARGWE